MVMSDPCLTFEVVEPDTTATASVIWMHGLGANGHDFVPITQWYHSLRSKGVRFIFPHAPVQPVSINQGMKMPAWFDIYDLNFLAKEDETGILSSENKIKELIEREGEAGILPNKIVLAGFSQGGAMALQVGLHFKKALAGIVVLSAYLPLSDTLSQTKTKENENTPILMTHGLFDPVVSLSLGERSKDMLASLGYTLEWKTYPIQHTVVQEEIEYVGTFLERVLG